MKNFIRLPFYMGIFVLVASILFSAVTIGEKQALISQKTKAALTGADLSMQFISPNKIGILLNSEKEVAGIDVVIKFDKEKIEIMPSTLSGGSSFTTTGGIADETKGIFSFSALAKTSVQSGVVATFNLKPKSKEKSSEISLEFLEGDGNSAVIEKVTKSNILVTATGTTFNLSSEGAY